MSFDFAAVTAPFRMQPGLRRIAPGTPQLTPSKPSDRVLREKLAVLGAHANQALLSTPAFDAGPALAALCEHAAREHPAAFTWDGGRRIDALHLGWSLHGDQSVRLNDSSPEVGACLNALPASQRLPALLSLAFAEDFAVIDGRSARIPWLAVCLPSSWAPEEKIGLHFAQVHAPVADSQLLVTATDHLVRLVTGDERWERFVWTITRHPRLHAHPAHVDSAPWPVDIDAARLAARAFFRTERQTFIPLPSLQQAVFTIHINVQPLAQAFTSAAQARQVHDALATMSPAVLAYRGLSDARERLLAWLATQTQT